MVNIAQIISMVQSNINDLAGERIQSAEYIDHCNFVAMDIAEETEIYVGRHTSIPRPLGVTTATYNVNIPYNDTTRDISVFRFIRVTRGLNGWTDCHEFSQQTISATISGNSSFVNNNTQLGRAEFLTMIGHPVDGIDGSINLIFGQQFEEGEHVVVDYISNRPWGSPDGTDTRALQRWNPNNSNPQTIPDFLRNAFEWGLMWRITESLYMKGDDSFANKADRSKQNYQLYLRQAVGYSKMLKDNRSALQSQPLNWLQEKD